MAVDYEELATRIQAGEVEPEDLTDEEFKALEANLTVTLGEVHSAILSVFDGVEEGVGEAAWQAISEAIAMNRVLNAIFGQLGGVIFESPEGGRVYGDSGEAGTEEGSADAALAALFAGLGLEEPEEV